MPWPAPPAPSPASGVGGPATTGPGGEPARAYLRRFLEHCVSGKNAVTGATGTQLDFVSFHTKGAHYSRRRVYGRHRPVERECPSSASMLRDIRAGLETVAEFPALAGRPVFVDECDPAVGTIYGVHDNPNFIVTNTEHYPTFLCALVKRVLDLDEAFERRIAKITTWAFYLEGKRFFEGNRTLVTREDVEKPILNAFRMLARLGDVRLGVTSTHARDVLRPGPRQPRSMPSRPGAMTPSPCCAGTRPTSGGWRARSPSGSRSRPSRGAGRWSSATGASTRRTPTPTPSGCGSGDPRIPARPSWSGCVDVRGSS